MIRATPTPGDTAKSDAADRTKKDYTADRSRQDLQPKNTVGTQSGTTRTDRSSIVTSGNKADRDTASRVDKNTPVKINDAVPTAGGKAARDSRGTAPDRTAASGHTPVARPIQVNQKPANDNNSSNGTVNPQVNINGNNNNVYVNGGDVNVSSHGNDPRYYHGHYPTPYHAYRHNTLMFGFGWNTDWYYDHGAYYLDAPWYSCGQIVSVPWNGYWGVTYYYPSYHRNFVFVSLGGYWPHYGYRRYYWYGCHPYRWYDYDVMYDTLPVDNNYYTTNNYYYTTESTSGSGYTSPYLDDFSDVRQKLQQQKLQQEQDQAQDKPNAETAADRNFSDAVSAFGRGEYNDAALKFRVGMVLEPKDIILPFAYAQALFAKGDYAAASATLRSVLISMVQPVEAGVQKDQGQDQGQETVYYPRGLYKKEEVLQQQIAALAAKVAANPNDTDLQLLLGYQLLGSGQADKALIPLGESAKDPANREPVRILLNLREKVLEDQKAAAGTVANPAGLSAAPAANTPTVPAAKKEE